MDNIENSMDGYADGKKMLTHIQDIEKIFEVILAFYSGNNRMALLDIMLSNMMAITNSDAGTLYTVEDEYLHFRIIRNKSLRMHQSSENGTIDLPPIALSEKNIQNISAYSAIRNEIVQVDDVYDSNDRFNFSGPKKYDTMTGYRTRAMLVVPICAKNETGQEVLGVIQLMNPLDKATGQPSLYNNIYDPPIVPALAQIAAHTLSNLIHVSEWQLFLRYFAAVMTHAIDERSPFTSNHTHNVAVYCERFAVYLRDKYPMRHPFHFDAIHTESIVLAAVLHDIGKIITPVDVLNKSTKLGERIETLRYRFALKKHQIKLDWFEKNLTEEQYQADLAELNEVQAFIEDINTTSVLTPVQIAKAQELDALTYVNPEGNTVPLLEELDITSLSIPRGTLTEVEREIVQRHVTVTTELLEKIPFWKYYGDIPTWAYCHHEFQDGTGYPRQLTASDIPIESCIITIMDIFDALIDKNRPYKNGMPIDQALEILKGMADEGKLHKELVGHFIESKIWEKPTDLDNSSPLAFFQRRNYWFGTNKRATWHAL